MEIDGNIYQMVGSELDRYWKPRDRVAKYTVSKSTSKHKKTMHHLSLEEKFNSAAVGVTKISTSVFTTRMVLEQFVAPIHISLGAN